LRSKGNEGQEVKGVRVRVKGVRVKRLREWGLRSKRNKG
jgi:hypothetical protein